MMMMMMMMMMNSLVPKDHGFRGIKHKGIKDIIIIILILIIIIIIITLLQHYFSSSCQALFRASDTTVQDIPSIFTDRHHCCQLIPHLPLKILRRPRNIKGNLSSKVFRYIKILFFRSRSASMVDCQKTAEDRIFYFIWRIHLRCT